MNKFIKVCEYILFSLFLILIPFMKDKLSILLSIPVLLLIFLANKKLNIKNYPLFIFVISLIIRIITSIYLKVEIADDFKTMFEASSFDL